MAGKKIRKTAEIVELDGKRRVSTLTFSQGAMLQYILEQGGWVDVGELARVAYGRSTEDNRRKVRNRLPTFRRRVAMEQNILIIPELKNRAVVRIKVCDVSNFVDRAYAEKWLEQSRKRKEFTEDVYEKICIILDANGL